VAKRIPLAGLEVRARRYMASTLHTIADRLEARMKENASLTDHSLKDLRRLGYPYSAKRPRNPHTPPYLVHAQSGELSKAIESNIINQYRIQVGVDEAKAPYIRHIVYGTERMLARDFITGSFLELEQEFPGLWEQALKHIVIVTGGTE